MLRALIAVLILPSGAAAAQIVEGHVVNAATGADLSGATVILGQNRPHPDHEPYRATTDARGRFRIEGVEDGTYIATYRAKGFWTPHEPDDITQPKYAVSAAGGPVHLEGGMQPIPALSGRVLDPAGKAVANATLFLIEQQHPCHTPSCFFVTKQFKTGERGEFSTAEFDRPGIWIAAAVAPDSLAPPQAAGGTAMAWAETFYPGVTDAAVAETMTVQAGVELPFVEIKLATQPARKIRGRILDAHGDPVPLIDVSLTNGFGPRDHEAADDKGNFEFDDLTAGQWRVSAMRDTEDEKLWAGETIRLGDRDVEDVQLRLAEPFLLSGQIVLRAPDGVSTEHELPNVIADYETGDFSGEAAPPSIRIGNPDKKGEFVIQLYPGRYRFVLLEDAPPGFYVESIRVDNADALTPDGVEIDSAAQITVTYAYGGGTIRGTAEGCNGGRVVILPRDPALHLPEFIREARCGPNGEFEIGGVRPGDYHALAIAGGQDPSGWALTNEDELLAKQATRVTVREGETAGAQVKVMRF